MILASEFDFALPPGLVAQHPAQPRDAARLLVVDGGLADRVVADLPDLLRRGDLLVTNDTRVIPAQLSARRGEARVGITLDRPDPIGNWTALARNARRLHLGDVLVFDGAADFTAAVVAQDSEGGVTLRFNREGEAFAAALEQAGAIALPPYIQRPQGPTEQDREDYQTAFAQHPGAVAAPTAGLHFTAGLLDRLAAAGIGRTSVTLHVGAGTFLPMRHEQVSAHRIHAERGAIGEAAAEAIAAARRAGGRIVAVGTTTLRLLESAADARGTVRPFAGDTNLFILPGHAFRAADLLLTNFHLPRSTLFMLVCAFAGTERMKAAYAHAIAQSYRFYSYGDATLLRLDDAARAPRTESPAIEPRVTSFFPSIDPAPAPVVSRNRHEPSALFSWRRIASAGAARAGVLHTAHGDIETPVFMPVGTAGTVKAMTADAVRATGAGIVLANTYHLMLRPGAERIAELGGLHRFMDWPGPILTDSGGFQIMSLGALRKLDDDGVIFRSHLDGSEHRLTPARAVALQLQFDSTITMVLDECTPFPATHDQAATSMTMSMRWAALSRAAFTPRAGYALFGIVQGGTYNDLRERSAAALIELGFDGYAIGGLAVGEGQAAMLNTLDFTLPHLPEAQPRYLMGVGTPDDLIGAVSRGVDMFDCVMPTRAGRTGRAFTSRGVLNMRNACHAADPAPVDPDCGCPACAKHSRAYLHHLFRASEMLGPMLLTWHNLAYYQDLMRGLRRAIVADDLPAFAARVRAGWTVEAQ